MVKPAYCPLALQEGALLPFDNTLKDSPLIVPAVKPFAISSLASNKI